MERDWEKRTITILGKEYNYNKLETEMQNMCGFLGFGTKLVDNLAGMKAYSSEEKLEKVDKVFDNLVKGEWRVPGEGKQTMKKKMDEAKAKASASELEVLKKLGLI
jgi:uncharacterized membrane protein